MITATCRGIASGGSCGGRVPAEIQQRFRGRKYIDLEPELLDYPGAELIFIDTKEAVEGLAD